MLDIIDSTGGITSHTFFESFGFIGFALSLNGIVVLFFGHLAGDRCCDSRYEAPSFNRRCCIYLLWIKSSPFKLSEREATLFAVGDEIRDGAS